MTWIINLTLQFQNTVKHDITYNSEKRKFHNKQYLVGGRKPGQSNLTQLKQNWSILLHSKVLPLFNLWCLSALFLWAFENLGIVLQPEIIHQCHYMYSPSQIKYSWLKIFNSYYYSLMPFVEVAYWIACGLITL